MRLEILGIDAARRREHHLFDARPLRRAEDLPSRIKLVEQFT